MPRAARFIEVAGSTLERVFRKIQRRHTKDRKFVPCDLILFAGGKMILLSRSFIRKRAISLATAGLVAATSLALARGPMGYHVRGAIPIEYVTDQTGDFGETPFLSEN